MTQPEIVCAWCDVYCRVADVHHDDAGRVICKAHAALTAGAVNSALANAVGKHRSRHRQKHQMDIHFEQEAEWSGEGVRKRNEHQPHAQGPCGSSVYRKIKADGATLPVSGSTRLEGLPDARSSRRRS